MVSEVGLNGLPVMRAAGDCRQLAEAVAAEVLVAEAVVAAGSHARLDKLSIYNRAVFMTDQSDMDEERVRLNELSALVELGLGKRLDDATFDKLAAIQNSLRAEQQKLSKYVADGVIKDKDYLSHLNSAVRRAMDESKKLLGYERFKSIFGEAGNQPEQLIDPKIFFGQKPYEPTRAR
jgi:hypothetical protein